MNFRPRDRVLIVRHGRVIYGNVIAADAERFAVLFDGSDGPPEIFLQDTPEVQRAKRQRRRGPDDDGAA